MTPPNSDPSTTAIATASSNGPAHPKTAPPRHDDNGPQHHHTTNIGVLHSGNQVGRDELLKKIGGRHVLHKAVDDFYNRLLEDPQIRPFFVDGPGRMPISVLKWHQYNLMSIAFHNVPADLDVERLILEKHEALFDAPHHLDEKVYDLVLEHFSATLRDLDVPDAAIQQALGVVQPLRAVFAKGAALAAQRERQQQRRRRMVTTVAAVAASTAALWALRLVWNKQNHHHGDTKTRS